jgi:hypothetical protein
MREVGACDWLVRDHRVISMEVQMVLDKTGKY